MNVLIAKIIKDRLSTLPYFDRVAGLVQTITKEANDTGKIVKFPVEVNVGELKALDAMVPDDQIKGLFYLEDGGIKSDGNNDWTSDLTLVCWFCPKKIAKEVDAVSANALADITGALKSFINESPVSRLKVNVASIPARDAAIFSKYNYSETQTQYLMPPYDFFALKLKCSFRLNSDCLEPLTEPEIC
ncbi:hypothetical protein [Sphingobacterium sp. LRF_L2]|uniref:hypothetical protein n=1 Tax=Sphingobacterium sp. LRF_L2 TaxID=3369421 RepID=UPI003F61721C